MFSNYKLLVLRYLKNATTFWNEIFTCRLCRCTCIDRCTPAWIRIDLRTLKQWVKTNKCIRFLHCCFTYSCILVKYTASWLIYLPYRAWFHRAAKHKNCFKYEMFALIKTGLPTKFLRDISKQQLNTSNQQYATNGNSKKTHARQIFVLSSSMKLGLSLFSLSIPTQ